MKSAKITILTRIRENKETLFGKFSEKLTKEDKDKKWKEITDEAKSLGATRDNRKKTGRGSGDDTHVTEMDTIVYDIIRNDSPVFLVLL
ncbi:hypothetical protein ILUMI_10199 [Ignelater luminosus]|uniref:Regulatory protein zeste n=1 Tax=Ignelater luminosus TaxID=2038154 RepID=A0A8K0D7L4_IGNLU|nr:hypothetical protein ILUMI_10199 [Ignelater luminosus]